MKYFTKYFVLAFHGEGPVIGLNHVKAAKAGQVVQKVSLGSNVTCET